MLLQKESAVIEKSWYEASVERQPVCDALEGEVTADVCVVGGGYAGLSCALELAQSGFEVVLLEAFRVGWGASGRNGGQAIVGFGAEGECAIEEQFSAEDARRAWDISVEGLSLLEQRIERFRMECEYSRGYLTVAIRERKCRELLKYVEHVQRAYRYPLQWIERGDIGRWISSERFVAGVFDPRSGHLHPLKYCLALAEAARIMGVRIFERSPAFRLERGNTAIVKSGTGQVACRFVVLAGNVYLGEFGDSLAPEIASRIMPVGTYMVATQPMESARANALIAHRAAVSDNNFVLDYFRVSADNRLLFGAGETYNAKTPHDLVDRMRRRMLGVFPQLDGLRIDYAWGGFVDVTLNRAPHLGRLGSNVYFMQGFSGHGLVFSGMAGKLVAEAIEGQAGRFDVFARLRHGPFPGGRLFRTPAVLLGTLYYRLRDIL
ncbi:NAD(P)/FAD-dependent oxidoreductase [Paraburkholderia diazotrophica]|uniref:Gamma-glutamylputrescine oxidase n=1 Tax=Paraburkholderia diazotrophica TaxID=667676 RepID=A0A1H6WP29_9BURK|nr:FAD-binding oxidoreductase [Paraburkholderia diazotrophica]SEJ14232.1 gamma-glutamylputrescine oxidase [Paraburkholderia diazotrophica]